MSPYLQYFCHTHERVGQLRIQERTRRERVLPLEEKIYAAHADPKI